MSRSTVIESAVHGMDGSELGFNLGKIVASSGHDPLTALSMYSATARSKSCARPEVAEIIAMCKFGLFPISHKILPTLTDTDLPASKWLVITTFLLAEISSCHSMCIGAKVMGLHVCPS